ncbi:MAG: hypothetical protein LKJ69_01575 [Lactobacillus sp.]|jgi:hypothetical protein|nr:hypothetical protein [Lactobacillus sp.]
MRTLSEIREAHPDWNVNPTPRMGSLVNCADCGKRVEFGRTYTSLEAFTDGGAFGLPVCGECYTKELHRRGERNG